MVKQRFGYGEFSIKSFKDRVSYNVKAIDPRIRTGLLLGRENAGLGVRLNEYFPGRRMKKCGADFISPHYLLCTREYIRRMQKKNIPLYVWTVNDRKVMKKLIRQGVTAIISDRPDVCNRPRSVILRNIRMPCKNLYNCSAAGYNNNQSECTAHHEGAHHRGCDSS